MLTNDCGWKKSSYSASNGQCIEAEARSASRLVNVRDSKLGEASAILSFSPKAWNTFLEGIRTDTKIAGM